MIKLLGSVLIASGGGLAWYLQRSERKRRRALLEDFQTAFRRMGEEIRMARTPLPVMLRSLSESVQEEAAVFFRTVSQAARDGEDLSRAWRDAAAALTLDEDAKTAVTVLGDELKGDEEKVYKGISHASYTLAKIAGEVDRKHPEIEKRAAALWFSASALLVILLI